MSRKGKLPIPIPKDVEVKVKEGNISVKGPKGTLQHSLMPGIGIKVENQEILVFIEDPEQKLANFHGLYRSLIDNMVKGTTSGFEKKLEMIGVGYRAAVQGKELDLQLGFSHPMRLLIPEGLNITVEKGTAITVKGNDKQVVGQFAATIRSKRPPEPYQGKGIRYLGEYVRKKAGKAAAAAKK